MLKYTRTYVKVLQYLKPEANVFENGVDNFDREELVVELRELREHIRHILDLPKAEQPDIRELLLQIGRNLHHLENHRAKIDTVYGYLV